MNSKMYYALKQDRKRRLKQKANLRYRRKNPPHRMKYGHNFKNDEAFYNSKPVCQKCGREK